MIIDIYLYFATMFMISPIVVLLLLGKKTKLQLYLLSLFYFSILTLIHHYFSLQLGRFGFSVLTKGFLDDELIYHYTTIAILKSTSFNAILDMQESLVGYSSFKSIFFAMLSSPFYYIIASKIIVAKAIVVFFSSLAIITLYDVLLNFFNNKKAFRFSLVLFVYPSFMIHSVQFEKDTFVLFLFLIYVKYIVQEILHNKNANILIMFIIISILAFYRPQYALVATLSLLFIKIFLQNKIIIDRSLLFFTMSLILLFPLPVVVSKIYFPEVFFFLDSSKAYSVFAGQVGFLKHDYSNYISTLITLIISLYYFLFGPISILIFKAGAFWKLMIIEPIIFSVFPIFLIIKNAYKKNIKDVEEYQLIIIFLFIILMYSYLSVVFESHFSGYMRKRMMVYVLLYILGVSLYSKSKFDNEIPKDKAIYCRT